MLNMIINITPASQGLRAFKAKLRPDGWEPICVAAAPGRSPWIAVYDGLTAFARGSMFRFGVATLARGPVAVPAMGQS